MIWRCLSQTPPKVFWLADRYIIVKQQAVSGRECQEDGTEGV